MAFNKTFELARRFSAKYGEKARPKSIKALILGLHNIEAMTKHEDLKEITKNVERLQAERNVGGIERYRKLVAFTQNQFVPMLRRLIGMLETGDIQPIVLERGNQNSPLTTPEGTLVSPGIPVSIPSRRAEDESTKQEAPYARRREESKPTSVYRSDEPTQLRLQPDPYAKDPIIQMFDSAVRAIQRLAVSEKLGLLLPSLPSFQAFTQLINEQYHGVAEMEIPEEYEPEPDTREAPSGYEPISMLEPDAGPETQDEGPPDTERGE